jgi:hypothetical protein
MDAMLLSPSSKPLSEKSDSINNNDSKKNAPNDSMRNLLSSDNNSE